MTGHRSLPTLLLGGHGAVPAPPLPQEPPAAPGHPVSIHVAPQHPWHVPAEVGMLLPRTVLGCAWHPGVWDQALAGSPQYLWLALCHGA